MSFPVFPQATPFDEELSQILGSFCSNKLNTLRFFFSFVSFYGFSFFVSTSAPPSQVIENAALPPLLLAERFLLPHIKRMRQDTFIPPNG